MTKMKYAIAAVAVAVAAYAVPASATPVASCGDITTVGGFASAGSCTIGDKTFTYSGQTTLAGTIGLAFGTIGAESYVAFQSFPGVGQGAPFSAVFAYTVSVNDPNYVIGTVEIDSTVSNGSNSGDTIVTKYLGGQDSPLDTITSTNGSVDVSTYLGVSSLFIYETVTVGTNDLLQSVQNTINQQHVPVPAMLGLLGMGLMGLGAAARRRKAA